MHDHVGVAPDRGGEVRVDLAQEPVVPEFGVPLRPGAKVLGGDHACLGDVALVAGPLGELRVAVSER